MKQVFKLFVLFFLPVAACNNTNSAVAVNHAVKSDIVIDIQPFTGITKAQTTFVFNGLKKVFPSLEIKPTIDLPKSAYYPQRNRYRADSLIRFLSNRTADGHTTIGLTNKDISTTKGKYADWGVMGLAYCPGNCIASSFRLSKTETNMQLFKVAIHELGHTQGLPHCTVKFCFMRDAEGGNRQMKKRNFVQCANHF